jgi:single-strand DNA-binding protein
LKHTVTAGVPMARFTLAVDRPYQSGRGKDGASGPPPQKETDFIRIVCWSKLAELVAKHLGRGRLVAVEGRLEIRNWETVTGERRTMTEVRANDVRFLDRAPQRGGDHGGPEAYGDGGDDSYEGGDEGHAGPRAPHQPQQSGGGRKDFGKFDNSKIDEEINLDDDDPYKEDFKDV